jgi:hypothetical protein
VHADVYLEVVWQLSSASIPRVHGDEDSASWVQREFSAFKDKGLQFPDNGLLNAENLLGYHRQHFYLWQEYPADRALPQLPQLAKEELNQFFQIFMLKIRSMIWGFDKGRENWCVCMFVNSFHSILSLFLHSIVLGTEEVFGVYWFKFHVYIS